MRSTDEVKIVAIDTNKTIISLDVKSLYTNVSLKEATDFALQKLYSQDSPPEIGKAIMKRLFGGQECVFQVL